jgi:hypothetical protein
MMRKTTILILILLLVAVGSGLAGVATGIDLVAHPPPQPTAVSGSGVAAPQPASNEVSSPTRLPCTAVEQRTNFPNSWAGESFDGLGVTAVLRRCDKPQPDDPGRANYVSYIYGDCDPAGSDEGCAPPIEIQSWPAAEVTPQMFASAAPDGQPRPGTDTTVGGLPATKYDGGEMLVVFRPRSTVMVFGRDQARVERFGKKSAAIHGPPVLTELAQFGLVFDRSCLALKGYCVASRTSHARP